MSRSSVLRLPLQWEFPAHCFIYATLCLWLRHLQLWDGRHWVWGPFYKLFLFKVNPKILYLDGNLYKYKSRGMRVELSIVNVLDSGSVDMCYITSYMLDSYWCTSWRINIICNDFCLNKLCKTVFVNVCKKKLQL